MKIQKREEEERRRKEEMERERRAREQESADQLAIDEALKYVLKSIKHIHPPINLDDFIWL